MRSCAAASPLTCAYSMNGSPILEKMEPGLPESSAAHSSSSDDRHATAASTVDTHHSTWAARQRRRQRRGEEGRGSGRGRRRVSRRAYAQPGHAVYALHGCAASGRWSRALGNQNKASGRPGRRPHLEVPLLRLVAGHDVVVRNADERAVVEHGDEDEHEHGHLEEVRELVVVVVRVQREDGDEEKGDQLQRARDTARRARGSAGGRGGAEGAAGGRQRCFSSEGGQREAHAAHNSARRRCGAAGPLGCLSLSHTHAYSLSHILSHR